MIGARLGSGTAGLLGGSIPQELRGDTLIVGFPARCRVQKQMCESNGRVEQIASVLSERWGKPVRMKFEMIAETQAEEAEGPARSATQRRYEILNDPGVKTLLAVLDATITRIEED
jgi:hypothetical protein